MAEKQPGVSDADSPDAQPAVSYSPVDGHVLRVALLSRSGQVPASMLELVAGEDPPVIIAWNGTLATELLITIRDGTALDAALIEASLGARNPSSSLVIDTLREHGVPAVLLGPSPLALAQRALIAGAAGIIDNEVEPNELLFLLRRAATGEIVRTDTYVDVLTAALPKLTNREADVLTLMSQGLTYKQIARELNIAEGTVGKYVEGIRGKYRALGVPDVGTSQLLLVRAGRDGFLDEPLVGRRF